MIDVKILLMMLILIWILIVLGCEQSARNDSLSQQINTLLSSIANQRVGMLTNPTSVDGEMKPIFEHILEKRAQYNITVECFFAPEHGLRGDRQDGKGDDDYIDEETGIQVYSLYGSRKAPTRQQVERLDVFIYDIQDVGVRYYTYIWTLTYTIEVLAPMGIKVVVMDRPNPLGRTVEGCPLAFDAGLVGRLLPGQQLSIPLRYGLTIGELVSYLKPYLPAFTYEVIKMQPMYEMEETDWVMTSPNMPSLGSVHVYGGMGLMEGTSISEGRGTTKPFQITGYPGVEGKKVREALLPNIQGASIREVYFIPTFSKHQGEVCGGVQVMPHSLSPHDSTYKSVSAALYTLKAYITQEPSITFTSGIDKLFGVIGFEEKIRKYAVQDIVDECESQGATYREEYERYWLYERLVVE